jgi:hypothetical protein
VFSMKAACLSESTLRVTCFTRAPTIYTIDGLHASDSENKVWMSRIINNSIRMHITSKMRRKFRVYDYCVKLHKTSKIQFTKRKSTHQNGNILCNTQMHCSASKRVPDGNDITSKETKEIIHRNADGNILLTFGEVCSFKAYLLLVMILNPRRYLLNLNSL